MKEQEFCIKDDEILGNDKKKKLAIRLCECHMARKVFQVRRIGSGSNSDKFKKK